MRSRRHTWRRPGVGAAAVVLLCLGAVPAVGRERVAAAPANASLSLVLPLVADDAGLVRFARAVSTPGSPLYGAYQPVRLLAERFGAGPAVRVRAVRFLRAAGGRRVAVSPTGMFATASLSVARAERAFGVRLEQVSSTTRGRFIAPRMALGAAGTAAVRLPIGLQGVATGVIGLDTEPLVPPSVGPSLTRRARAAAGAPLSGYEPVSGTPAGCRAGVATGGFTPQQYLSAYGYGALRRAGLEGQGQRVALIEIDGFKRSDLRTYAACFGVGVPKLRTFAVGARHALAPGVEATLDLEVLESAAPALAEIDVYEITGNAAEVANSLAVPLFVPGRKPAVVSASLGLCEPLMFRAFGPGGIVAVERDVELAAAAGITEVAASGDQGAEGCVDRRRNPIPALAVEYPAASPFVTAVGGTNFVLTAQNTIARQVVWNDGVAQPAAGGGGFSDLFDRPSYQRGTVAVNRRALPDVSMLADLAPGYAVYCTASGDAFCPRGRPWHTVGGTSAAAPLFAAGAALVDQDLRRHGREALGFANPLIYHLARSAAGAGIFSDVTRFDNDLAPFLPGSGGASLGCCTARRGFDEA